MTITLVLWPTGDNNNTCRTVSVIPFQHPAIHRHLHHTNKTHTYTQWMNTSQPNIQTVNLHHDSFTHLAACLTTGPKPLPKPPLQTVRPRASSFKWEYPLLSSRSFSTFLRLLPHLPVTSIPPFILPSITLCRRQFLCTTWPIQAGNLLTSWETVSFSKRSVYTECHRRNGPNFGRVFLMLKYTDITQNTYIQSWAVTEIMAREVWNFDSCYSLIDYQIHIETGRNMWFL